VSQYCLNRKAFDGERRALALAETVTRVAENLSRRELHEIRHRNGKIADTKIADTRTGAQQWPT
jgi:hypothetical protein